jgi:hypothetical protein
MCRILDRARLWFTPTRGSVRWMAFALGVLCIVLAFVAYNYPIRCYVGPLRISLRSMRNPITAAAVCALVWYLTSHRNFARILAGRDASLSAWRSCSYGLRAVLLVLVANVALGAYTLVQYPYSLLYVHMWYAIGRESPAWVDHQVWHSYIQHFAERCQRELPPDARILYHGHIESMEFAYEVYPRRVFMLPCDLYAIAGSWHKQQWLAGMPNDPLEAYWHRDFPSQTTDRETFIREHGITHEAFFDPDSWFECRFVAIQPHEAGVAQRQEAAPR